MLTGLLGVLLRLLLRQGVRYAFTEGRSRNNEGVLQGIGLIFAGGVVALGSVLLLQPVIFYSIFYLILDGIIVLALVGGGIVRLVVGLFTFNDNTEARSGPAMSPVNYYVALPEEMPAGYCWQCGRRVKLDSLICLRCGATQPKGAQQRAMMSAPTFERGGDSGHWPQWQPEEEEDPLERLGPGPMGPGRFPRGAPYPPPGQGAPYPPPGPGAPYPPYPPQHMPPGGPGFPAFPLPSRPMGRPPRGAPFPGAPFPPRQQPPARGRPPRERPPRERPPREKKPSRPRWGR